MRELPTSPGRALLRSAASLPVLAAQTSRRGSRVIHRHRSAAWQIVLICGLVAGLFGTGVAADQIPPSATPPPGEPEVNDCVHREAIAASIAKLDAARAANTSFDELLRQMADIEKRILQLKPGPGRTCQQDVSIVGLSERFDPIRHELLRERRLQEIGRKPWPEHVKRAVLENRAELGMTREQVTAALGEPRNVDVTPTTRQEQWTYSGPTYLYFTDGALTLIARARRPSD